MTEDNELIEHIARAICKGRNMDPDTCVEGGGNSAGEAYCLRRRWQWYEADARAALTAYRNHQVEL